MESRRESNPSKWFRERWKWICKNWWYLLLLIGSTIYVFIYRYEIFALTSINALAVGAFIWLILLILPLFSELEFFGIKLKKELEKISNDVKASVDEVKNQIVELRVNNSNNTNLYFQQPPLPDKKEMKGLNTEVDQLEATLDKTADKVDINDISEENILLFKVRLKLEKTLADICYKTDYKGVQSILQMLRHATRCELISYEIGNLAMQLYKIANRGVHGEIIDKEYIKFAEKTYPLIFQQLEEVQSKIKYISCRKCGYDGYTNHVGNCPRCGEYSIE